MDERGIFNLSLRINIAHPRYRDELTKQAIANGLRLSALAKQRRPPSRG